MSSFLPQMIQAKHSIWYTLSWALLTISDGGIDPLQEPHFGPNFLKECIDNWDIKPGFVFCIYYIYVIEILFMIMNYHLTERSLPYNRHRCLLRNIYPSTDRYNLHTLNILNANFCPTLWVWIDPKLKDHIQYILGSPLKRECKFRSRIWCFNSYSN